MTIATFATGLQAATVGTEHFVATPTGVGYYQFLVDLATLVANDVVELRVYKALFNGQTERCVDVMPYYGVQPTDQIVSVSPLLMNDLTQHSTPMRFSIKQTFGTSRTFPWVVQRDDAAGGSGTVDTGEIVNAVWATPVRTVTGGTITTVTTTISVASPVGVGSNYDKTGYTLTQAAYDQLTNQVWATPVRAVTSVSSPVGVASNYDKGNYTLTTAGTLPIADAFLNRDMSTGTDSGSTTVRTPRQALRFFRNKWSIAGDVLTVTKEDDTTASWTAVLATSASANPVVGSDPAGP